MRSVNSSQDRAPVETSGIRTPAYAPFVGRRGNVLGNITPISDRPPEAADRAIPGHWEGDLVRHEALLNRAVMKGHRLLFVAADS